jgi:hypothetical protein
MLPPQTDPASLATNEREELSRLAAELPAHGLHATLHELPGRLPCLDVRNPAAAALTERIYAASGSFWWSWAERIAACDDPAATAAALARVLRTTDTR